jgi:hypothetical protein
MTNSLRGWLAVFTLALLTINTFAVTPGVEYIGRGSVSGSALDKSGLAGEICQAGNLSNCVPKSILGGFGSDVTYTGHDNVFIAAPDRGPFDGLTDVPYIDRFHFFHIVTDLTRAFNERVRMALLDTRLMRDESGQNFLGAAGAFDLRFDPEGIRVAPDGTFYVSDEYGTYVFQFDRQGNIIRRLPVPSRFFIANPSENPTTELLGNLSGRQANRGMEGLAISPDGSTLFGLMQNALLQDNGLVPNTTDRLGRNNRLLKIDLATGQTSEYVYVLDAINRGQGTCEILAINDHEFLVVERDNRSWLAAEPQAPTRKTIYKIDITGATDVSGVASLPAGALPFSIVPVQKTTPALIDLLDPAFGLNLNDANAIAEKIEALAWGPDLADGRHVLYVFSDNDLNPNLASQVFAFAIDPEVLDYEPQLLPGPLFPPGQVKKLPSLMRNAEFVTAERTRVH